MAHLDADSPIVQVYIMVRPRVGADRRRQNFTLRLSQLERALLSAAADQAGETLPEFIRRSAIERAIRLTRADHKDDTEDEHAQQHDT